MSVLILPKYYSSQKPPLGSQLNFGHPLAQGLTACFLFNELGGNNVYNLANSKIYSKSATLKWGKTGIKNGSGSSEYITIPTNDPITTIGDYTIVVKTFEVYDTRILFRTQNTNPLFLFGSGVTEGVGGTSNKLTVTTRDDGGTNLQSDSSNTSIVGLANENTWAWARRASAGTHTWFLNGMIDKITTGRTTATIHASTNAQIFQKTTSASSQWNGTTSFIYFYSRCLSLSEIQSLYVAPYQFIYKPTRRFYSLPSAAPSTQTYTRGASGTLPSDDTDLATAYSAQDYLDVATADDTRVEIVGGNNEYTIHQFKDNVGGLTTVNLSWEGQTSVGPPPLTVYLQIYNINTTTWDTLDSKTSVASNTDFQLVKSSLSLTNYKNGSNFISCRVYQLKEVPSATTLRTDLWAIPTAPASPTVGLHQFIMCN